MFFGTSHNPKSPISILNLLNVFGNRIELSKLVAKRYNLKINHSQYCMLKNKKMKIQYPKENVPYTWQQKNAKNYSIFKRNLNKGQQLHKLEKEKTDTMKNSETYKGNV